MGTKRIKQSPSYGFPESGLARCEMLSWANLKYVYIRTLHIHVVKSPVRSRAEHAVGYSHTPRGSKVYSREKKKRVRLHVMLVPFLYRRG